MLTLENMPVNVGTYILYKLLENVGLLSGCLHYKEREYEYQRGHIDLKINDAEAFVPHPLHSSVISNPNFPTADLLLS